MKRWLALAMVLAMCPWGSGCRRGEAADPQDTTALVRRDKFVVWINARGRCLAESNVTIAPPRWWGLKISKLVAKEGDKVEAGTVLAELDHSMAEAQLQKATAQANFTAVDFKMTSALASEQGISMQSLDKSRQSALMAQADLKIAQIALDRTYIKSPVSGIIVQKTATIRVPGIRGKVRG